MNNQRFDTILFDLDGTLIDTLDDLRNAVNHALTLQGFAPRSREEVCSFVGNGIGLLVRRAAGNEPDEETYAALYRDFSAYYNEHYDDFTLPYDGIPELLKTLKARGYTLGVLTNKREDFARALCDGLFPGIFDAVAGEAGGTPRKPQKEAVDRLIAMLGADPAACLYLGDSQVDVETARNAGLTMVTVTWGFRDRETLSSCGAENLIDAPGELLTFLEKGGDPT